MNKLTKMSMLLKMDREIIPQKHYISPGGYEVAGKQFDFLESEGVVCEDKPDEITYYLRYFDDTTYQRVVTPDDLKIGFSEFFIFTGEYDDPEINVKEVKEVSFL